MLELISNNPNAFCLLYLSHACAQRVCFVVSQQARNEQYINTARLLEGVFRDNFVRANYTWLQQQFANNHLLEHLFRKDGASS